MNSTWGEYLLTFIIGLGLIINGVFGLKNRKKRAKVLQKYFWGLLSESVCEKLFFVIGPFFLIVGLIFFVLGFIGLFLGN